MLRLQTRGHDLVHIGFGRKQRRFRLFLNSDHFQIGKPKQGLQRLSVGNTPHMTDNSLPGLAFFVAVILHNLDSDILGRLAT